MKINVVDRDGCAHELEADAGDVLMQPLSDANLVDATCGGACSCATCQIYVGDAWLPLLPASKPEEAELISELLNTRPNSRLACQIVMCGELDGLKVEVAPE